MRSGYPSRSSVYAVSLLTIFFSLQVISQTKPSPQPDTNQAATTTTQPNRRAANNSGTNASNTPQAVEKPQIPSIEPKESFSQLTLFLFASGLALFVALLGWSDQIRGIDKDTKELESRFLEDTGINKRDFLNIVKPQSSDQQLEALAQVGARLKTRAGVDLLRTFKRWNSEWSRLENLSAWKYNLTVTLTVALFVAGVVSLFTNPSKTIRLYVFTFRTEILVLMLPMSLIAGLLGIIIYSARREKVLRSLLASIADMV